MAENETNTTPQLLTPREAAEVLKVHYLTVLKLLNEGRLPGLRVGGQWRINRDELIRALQEGRLSDDGDKDESPSASPS